MKINLPDKLLGQTESPHKSKPDVKPDRLKDPSRPLKAIRLWANHEIENVNDEYGDNPEECAWNKYHCLSKLREQIVAGLNAFDKEYGEYLNRRGRRFPLKQMRFTDREFDLVIKNHSCDILNALEYFSLNMRDDNNQAIFPERYISKTNKKHFYIPTPTTKALYEYLAEHFRISQRMAQEHIKYGVENGVIKRLARRQGIEYVSIGYTFTYFNKEDEDGGWKKVYFIQNDYREVLLNWKPRQR